jgi:hypothetical protein
VTTRQALRSWTIGASAPGLPIRKIFGRPIQGFPDSPLIVENRIVFGEPPV